MNQTQRSKPGHARPPSSAADIQRLQATIKQLEHSERLQRALFDIANTTASGLDMQSLLKRLHGIIAQLMYAENFFIALHNPLRQTLRFIYFADTRDGQYYSPNQVFTTQELANTITLRLIRHGQPMRGQSDAIASSLGLHPRQRVGTPSTDFMGVPMLRNGEVLGLLAVQSYEPGQSYTAADQDVLAFVAEHVLNAVERKLGHEALEHRVAERTRELALANAQLKEQIQERERAAHLQTTLYRIAALSHNQDTQENFYRNIHAAVGELLNATNFVIALVSEDGKNLEFPYYVDHSGTLLSARPMSKGMSEYAIRRAETLLLDNHQIDLLIAQGEVDASTYGAPASSWLGAPLLGPHGVMGVVVVQSYQPDMHYTPQDADLLTFVSYQIASTLQRRLQDEALQALNAQLEQRVLERTQELRKQINVREQAQRQLRHQVMHDPLTGLPNRLYLRNHLDQALARQHIDPTQGFALLYLDVDRFKLFNDNLGHLTGDAVLKAVAERLAGCVRSPDILGRLAGDEFAILLNNCPRAETASRVAQRIQTRMEAAIRADDRLLHVSISIGIAMSTPDYQTVDQLLHDADTALYQAKLTGRQRFVLFDKHIQTAAMNVLDLEQQMRTALDEAQFVPYFQPIVSLNDGIVTGYEALIRWRHPERGLLSPAAFLPAAEATGLIEAIDWHMYQLALTAAVPLLGQNRILNINISPRHFQNRHFFNRLLNLLERTGVHCHQLCIEVTEGTLLSDPAGTGKILQAISETGIRIALDDFGTGYSSLSHVHQFPIKTLKIDRSFITPLGTGQPQRSSAIVAAVLSLAASLALSVVAEGVETDAQRDKLRAMGCDRAQGYLFGRPAPATAYETPA
ncbi:EAL domain-containing protein [Castellaniella hirudinis]|uniref:EAL domain-containing protein n=1 Tax=Castellaniella hirudinis TaxID=1144617 RepID=UPI0039C20B27